MGKSLRNYYLVSGFSYKKICPQKIYFSLEKSSVRSVMLVEEGILLLFLPGCCHRGNIRAEKRGEKRFSTYILHLRCSLYQASSKEKRFYRKPLYLVYMTAIEQKIVALFTSLPFSLKTRIVAVLSQLVATEVEETESTEELIITDGLKKRISDIEERHTRGEGKTYSKEEFRQHLDNLKSKIE